MKKQRDPYDHMDLVIEEILDELCFACEKFSKFASQHEGYAILLEEVDELWTEVKANNVENARKEAVQVAAMAIRFILDSDKRWSITIQ